MCKNYKTILKDITENLNQWKYIQCFRIRRQHVIKSFSPNLSVDAVQTQTKPHQVFKIKTDKLILKYIWKFKAPRIAPTILIKNKCGETTLTDLKFDVKPHSSDQPCTG